MQAEAEEELVQQAEDLVELVVEEMVDISHLHIKEQTVLAAEAEDHIQIQVVFLAVQE
jgi:hypothetical protein